jgi:hypothetical protein
VTSRKGTAKVFDFDKVRANMDWSRDDDDDDKMIQPTCSINSLVYISR